MFQPRIVPWLAMAATLFFASSAFAQQSGEERSPRRLDRLVQDLELSAEQEQQVRQLAQERRTATRPVREQLRRVRNELTEIWRSAEPSREQILAKHVEMDRLRHQVREAQVDFRLGLHALLSPEQRSRFAEQMQRRPGRRGDGRHRGAGPGRRGPRMGGPQGNR